MARRFKFDPPAATVEISSPRSRWLRLERQGSLLASLEWSVVGSLLILIIIGFGLRFNNLAASGFAEDEMNKLDAIHAYQHGDITANGEHPMMMKALMYASARAARTLSDGEERFSEEAVIRLPNVIIGALTVIPLFLLTTAFFDRWTGLLAAGFWAFGINAITFNRVGKEDTLLVFFMLFAFFFYLRAKQTVPSNTNVRRRNYVFSAASFGLMLASKYFPHYLGLNLLYHHKFHVRKAKPREPSGKTPLWFYLLIPLVFLVANPAVLMPQIWGYLNAYMGERLLVHTGYLFGDQLYKNNMSSSPFWGTPLYFYALFMAIKIPLLVLVAFVSGFVVSLKRWRHPGHAFVVFMFLFWIVPYSLIGAKWLRYTLSLMPFVYMLAAIGVAELVRLVTARLSAVNRLPAAVSVLAVVIFVGLPFWTASISGPHYALYTNSLGANKAGYFFPHDEFYDDGLREAIKFVCHAAPQGAIMAHETPAVARHYLKRFGRSDVSSHPLSAADFDPATVAGHTYIIVQRGRTYFENQSKLEFVRANFKKVHEVSINGLTAVEVFVNERG